MKSHRHLSLVGFAALCVVGILTACAQSAPHPPAETSPLYLDKVDSNGLINGKTLSQLSGEMAFECMQEAGWTNLLLAPDGSFGGNVPLEQGDKYDADMIVCQEQVEASYPQFPMSERAIRERYSLELGTRECLIEQGYEISEPPSEQTWVEQFNGATTGLWLPYWEVFALTKTTAAEEAALKLTCPDPSDRVYLQ